MTPVDISDLVPAAGGERYHFSAAEMQHPLSDREDLADAGVAAKHGAL